MTDQHTSDPIGLIGQRQHRLEKVRKLRRIGIDPYPSVARKTHVNSQIADEFEKLCSREVK